MSNPFGGEPDTRPKINFLNGMPSGPADLKLFIINIFVDPHSLNQDVDKVIIIARSLKDAETFLLHKYPKYKRVDDRHWEFPLEEGMTFRS